MRTISCLRRWMPILVLAALSDAPLCGQDVEAKNAGAKTPFDFKVGSTDNALIGLARLNDVTIIYQEAKDPGEREGEALPERVSPRRTISVTFKSGNFDQWILGKERDAQNERSRLARLLGQKIEAVDRACELSDPQKQRLRLAGRGDIKRLLDLFAQCKARFENASDVHDIDSFQNWATALSVETEAARSTLSGDPFDGKSLFARTLKTTLTLEQAAEYERSHADRLVAWDGVISPDSLDEILRGWERSASRIGRLDCEFMRFRYDPVFETERHGTGSLAVDHMGRAVYRIVPATIGPGEIARKSNRDGVPYKLKADEPDRWYWTGRSVIRVDDAARTFEEIECPSRLADGEFQPDAPELPEDAAPPVKLASAVKARPVRAEIDFWAIIEAMSQFRLARPYLLGMRVDEFRRRFDVTLISVQWPEVRLQFKPKQEKDGAWLERAILILNVDGYVPVALKEIDFTGAETVHVFKNASVIAPGKIDGDLLPNNLERLDRPNLSGYSKLRP